MGTTTTTATTTTTTTTTAAATTTTTTTNEHHNSNNDDDDDENTINHNNDDEHNNAYIYNRLSSIWGTRDYALYLPPYGGCVHVQKLPEGVIIIVACILYSYT